MYKSLIIVFIVVTSLFSSNNNHDSTHINIKEDLSSQTIVLNSNSYKILVFPKRIVDIRLSNANVISVNFEKVSKTPLSSIKVFAKNIGIVNALITFSDNSLQQVNFNVIEDIRKIISLIKFIDEDVTLVQVNNAVVLKGSVKNNKNKEKILSIINTSLPDIKTVDLLKVIEPDKMVRLKLYVAEINNNTGETIKNNWNYQSGSNDGTISTVVQTSMLNAVTLSGGLTATANKLGSVFNAGLTLNYLKTNGVAKILDETTLITLENKESKFLAGGNLLVQTSSISADGQPISTIEEIPYGLELKINIKSIINNQYIDLEIDTKSSTLDSTNGVGNMPATKEKSIKTNVVIQDKSTVILGGLINNTNSKDIDKMPFLGDIPIIGALFRSSSFQDGDSELIFFITPEIVDVDINTQAKKLENISNKIIKQKKVVEKEIVIKKTIEKEKTKEEMTNAQLHHERMKKIFGIE